MARITQRARSFRKRATEAEKILWRKLRNRQLAGLKFRRQQPVGSRIVDFYCAEFKIAIELDGSGHAYPAKRHSDFEREFQLQAQGVCILRFWNSAIFDNLDGVLNEIIYAADPEKSLWPNEQKACPHLNPLPKGEEVRRSIVRSRKTKSRQTLSR